MSKVTRATEDELLATARDAMSAAYCPYSNFPVGAAVLTADGHIYKGCNVENASFGLTVCAERNAVFAAVADGHLDIVAVAVATRAGNAATPCGACRQVIAEFSRSDASIVVISQSAAGERVRESIDALLPEQFRLL